MNCGSTAHNYVVEMKRKDDGTWMVTDLDKADDCPDQCDVNDEGFVALKALIV